MKAGDIKLTKLHFEGPYYQTKYEPHYILHVLKILEDGLALCWSYNARGAVTWDRVEVEDLEPYEKGGQK
jgi:hypothetical protein